MGNQAPLSFKVSTTLAAQRIVGPLSGTANTVKYPASTAEIPFGVTVDTVTDTTTGIPVQVSGIAKVLFNDTCASGNLVAADSSGRGVQAAAAATATAWYVGTLIGPAVAATGTIANVLIHPGQHSAG